MPISSTVRSTCSVLSAQALAPITALRPSAVAARDVHGLDCGQRQLPDELRSATNGDLEAYRGHPVRSAGRDHQIIHGRGRRLLERDAIWRSFAEFRDGPGGQQTSQEQRPEAVFEPSATTAR